ncbi:MAG: hypothetical protein WKF42_08680 [Solirubrobacteraceae bacterium]
MPKRSLPSIVLCIGLLSACGGSSQAPDRARDEAFEAAPRSPLELPAAVPLKPSGAADPDQAKVVRAWAAALRDGNINGAAALWAVPAKVQNGTPVLRLSSAGDVRAFNAALPCGSIVTSAGAAERDFTIATVRLTRRRGADCDAGTGSIARIAIRVSDGKINEWYRLPDDPDAPGLTPPPDDGESTTV